MPSPASALNRHGNRIVLILVPLLLMITLQPWLRVTSIQAFDFQRWLEVVCLVPVYALCFPYFLSRCIHAPFFSVIFLTVVVLGLLSAWHAYGFSFLWVAIFRAFLYVGVMVGFWGAWSESSDSIKKFFSATLLLGVGVYLIYSMLGALTLVAYGVFDRTFLVFGFSNVNHAGGFLLVVLFVLPGVLASFPGHGRVTERVVYVFSTLIVFLLLVIGSRGAVLAWLSVVGLLAFFRHEKQVSRYLRGLRDAAIGGLLVYVLFRIVLHIVGIDGLQSDKSLVADSGRLELYLRAWKGALESPWLGHGPLSYAGIPDIALGHAHNAILNTLYEVGFPCTLMLLGLLVYATNLIWKARARIITNPVALSGVAVLVAFAIHSQFSGLSMIPATMLVIIVASAFVASVWAPPPQVISPAWVVVGFLFGAALGACYLLMVLSYWQALDHDVFQKPRFWLQGGTETWIR